MRPIHIHAISIFSLCLSAPLAHAENIRPAQQPLTRTVITQNQAAPTYPNYPSYYNRPAADPYGYMNPAPQPQRYAPPPNYGNYAYNPQQPYAPPAAAVPTISESTSQRITDYRSHDFISGDNLVWAGVGAALIGGAAAAFIVGGATGDSGDSGATTIASEAEFQAQYGLANTNANVSMDRGLTGRGVTVAVMDSGLDLSIPEMRGRVVDGGGYDFVLDQAGQPTTSELDSHGTMVASIIAANHDGQGMMGVAYESKIMPIRVLDSDGAGSYADLIQGTDYFTASDATIMNVSLGPNDAAVELMETAGYQRISSSDLLLADAYLDAVAADKLLVFAAGNSYNESPNVSANPVGGGFYPFITPANQAITGAANGAYRDTVGGTVTADLSAMKPNTLVVVATDKNNVIAAFSNRCGVTKEWCLAAPGVDMKMAVPGGGYTADDALPSGTSFSAPHVSAAAAVLRQLFPSLTNAQVAQILLESAVDLGEAGVDDIYGHGLLDLARAVRPLGETGIALTSSVEGARTSLRHSSLRYGRAFGIQATGDLKAQRLMFLDSYDRAFPANTARLMRVTSDPFSSKKVLADFDNPTPRKMFRLNEGLTLAIRSGEADAGKYNLSGKPVDPSTKSGGLNSFTLVSKLSEDSFATLNYKDQDDLAFGFQESDRTSRNRSLYRETMGNPYASLVGDSYTALMKTEALGSTIRVAGYFGKDESNQDAMNFGTQMDASYNLGGKNRIGFGAGSLFEQKGLLGSRGEGAFAFGDDTATFYSGISARFALGGQTMLHGAAYAGWTDPGLAANSLITDSTSLISTAFNANVEHKGIAGKEDSLSFNLAQPLRVENGRMQFILPYARGATSDTIYRNDFTQDMAADGRELDIGFTYAVPLEQGTRLSFGALYRHNAGHVKDSADSLGVMRFTRRF